MSGRGGLNVNLQEPLLAGSPGGTDRRKSQFDRPLTPGTEPPAGAPKTQDSYEERSAFNAVHSPNASPRQGTPERPYSLEADLEETAKTPDKVFLDVQWAAIAEAEGQMTKKREEILDTLLTSYKDGNESQGPMLSCSTFLGGYMLSNSLSAGLDESAFMWNAAADLQRMFALISAMLNLITVVIIVVTQLQKADLTTLTLKLTKQFEAELASSKPITRKLAHVRFMQATTRVRRFAVYCFIASIPCAIASVAMAQLALGLSPWTTAFNVAVTVAGATVAALAARWLFRISSKAMDAMYDDETDELARAANTPLPASSGKSF